MTHDGTALMEPTTVRRLHGPHAQALADLASTFDELQTALRLCEHLVVALAPDHAAEVDGAVVEALWTSTLLCYARCFAEGPAGARLTPADVVATEVGEDAAEWHRTLLRLAAHHTDPVTNPREVLAVGVAQGEDGRPTGLAITSTPSPPVDEPTVRRTGALAFALSARVDEQITTRQRQVLDSLAVMSPADLAELSVVELTAQTAVPTPVPTPVPTAVPGDGPAEEPR